MKLLVVCLGNICRSPLAEGALRARIAASPLAGQVQVDSAGTGDWHVGQPPDPRAVACARGHGVDISMLRARQLRQRDYLEFDWLLCADGQNVRDVSRQAPPAQRNKVVLLTEWARVHEGCAVPDPYTGGPAEFEHAWRLVDSAARAVVARLCAEWDSGIIGNR
ncbi:low molecular weight protein-tyrosine-phosphatase [Pseudoxanthomonas sp. CF125]|uniref:low molecular weight protein-tyrosine-phosphatase n=1 Tax=Pseudoxanthomonas sp. CF125 TaxID=1855303 RepID=UPI000881BD93|nr:low molecular weight protein-tyrosine-phosphatase [Pseudoxanthomonas sp. CF125]SDQ36183.1 protein-tyrosine phosphatase [Pseudoxanthomonas sp. CF125]